VSTSKKNAPGEGASRLKAQLIRNRTARDANDARNSDSRLKQLQAWQAMRLSNDYADVRKIAKNKLACDFFLDELYGDADFAKRDEDVERIYPIMVKLLPSQVLLTVSRAVELNAMSHELDLAMLAHLPKAGVDQNSYARAYQMTNDARQRRHQLALILSLGRELARVVRIPLMFKLLQMCKWPAKMAGLGALQSFLERGFAAFVALDGAKPFLQEIRSREVQFMRYCLRTKT
jgi:hypothetical protein